MILDSAGPARRKRRDRDPGIQAKSTKRVLGMPQARAGESLSETAWRMMPEQQFTQKEFSKLPKKKPLTLKKRGQKPQAMPKRTQEGLREQALKTHAAILKRLAKT